METLFLTKRREEALPKVQFLPNQKETSIPAGKTLLEAAIKARVPLSHRCGGNGSCLTCKVLIDKQDTVTPLSDKELRMLGEDMIDQGYRLACQCVVCGDTVVKLPESPLKAAIRAQLQRQEEDPWD
jgi:ferredoxin